MQSNPKLIAVFNGIFESFLQHAQYFASDDVRVDFSQVLEVMTGFREDHQESLPMPTLDSTSPKAEPEEAKKDQSPAEAESPAALLASKGNMSRRGLRRKPDFTEQQLSQINLETLYNFRSYLTGDIGPRRQIEDARTTKILDFVYSTKQLLNCRRLVESKNMLSDGLSQGLHS